MLSIVVDVHRGRSRQNMEGYFRALRVQHTHNNYAMDACPGAHLSFIHSFIHSH